MNYCIIKTNAKIAHTKYTLENNKEENFKTVYQIQRENFKDNIY